jgi:hypothetical protein
MYGTEVTFIRCRLAGNVVKYPNSIAIFGYLGIDSHAFLARRIDRLTSFGQWLLHVGGVAPLNLRTRFLHPVKGIGNYGGLQCAFVEAAAGPGDGCAHVCS